MGPSTCRHAQNVNHMHSHLTGIGGGTGYTTTRTANRFLADAYIWQASSVALHGTVLRSACGPVSVAPPAWPGWMGVGCFLPWSMPVTVAVEAPSMRTRLLRRLIAAGRTAAPALHRRLLAVTRPPAAPLVARTLADLARGKPALIAESALLRRQLIILQRSVKRRRCSRADRTVLVLLAVYRPTLGFVRE